MGVPNRTYLIAMSLTLHELRAFRDLLIKISPEGKDAEDLVIKIFETTKIKIEEIENGS